MRACNTRAAVRRSWCFRRAFATRRRPRRSATTSSLVRRRRGQFSTHSEESFSREVLRFAYMNSLRSGRKTTHHLLARLKCSVVVVTRIAAISSPETVGLRCVPERQGCVLGSTAPRLHGSSCAMVEHALSSLICAQLECNWLCSGDDRHAPRRLHIRREW